MSQDAPLVRHWLLIVCLIRRKARTAGTYCPVGQNVHRLPRTWTNKLRNRSTVNMTITSSLSLSCNRHIYLLYIPKHHLNRQSVLVYFLCLRKNIFLCIYNLLFHIFNQSV